LCNLEAGFLSSLLSFESPLDAFDKRAVVAEAALFGDGFDLPGDVARR